MKAIIIAAVAFVGISGAAGAHHGSGSERAALTRPNATVNDVLTCNRLAAEFRWRGDSPSAHFYGCDHSTKRVYVPAEGGCNALVREGAAFGYRNERLGAWVARWDVRVLGYDCTAFEDGSWGRAEGTLPRGQW